MVNVTVSLTLTSPPTVPVMATLPPASAALMMLSAVILSNVMSALGAAVSTVYVPAVVAVTELPAVSVVVTCASTVKSGSATNALPGTLILKVLSASTTPVY